jgi:hypothetical protein
MKQIQKNVVRLYSQIITNGVVCKRYPFSEGFFIPLSVKVTAVLLLVNLWALLYGCSLATREMYSRFSVLQCQTTITMNNKETAQPSTGNQLPESLFRATKLIGEARDLINEFNESNPDLRDLIHQNATETEDLLEKSAYQISQILTACFLGTYFFFEWKEGAL